MGIKKFELWLVKTRSIIFWGELLLISGIILCLFLGLRGCYGGGNDNKKQCSSNGEVRKGVCPEGESGRLLEICKDDYWQTSSNECKKGVGDCSEIVFDRDVYPIINKNCVSCHTGYDGYETAKNKIDVFIARTALGDRDIGRMPKPPNEPLAQGDKDKFSKWEADGLLESCQNNNVNTNPHLNLDYTEDSAFKDISTINSSQQADIRWIILSHKSNEGADLDVLQQFKHSINKSVNSLSFVRGIINPVPIDQYETVFRINLRDYKLSAADWKRIEDSDPLDFESNTNIGVLLKTLTKTRKPILHIDSFSFSSNQAEVYYAVRKLPATAKELFVQTGVDFNGDINNFEALFVGFNNSAISLNKNRLLTRFNSNDGNTWISFDVDNVAAANKNLFEFPLLNNVLNSSGTRFYNPQASEFIGSIPNSLHYYYLSDNKGNRQNAAPQNIVQDNISPFGSEIAIGSCTRCHNSGYLPAKDEIRAHVVENAAQFPLQDVDIVEQLYRDPAEALSKDNSDYAIALSKLGILANEPDPISVTSDNLRRNQNAKSIAAYFSLTEEEFIEGLKRSAEGRAQVGQLLTGGEITSAQFIASLPVLKRDLRFGVEPLTQ